MTGRAGAVGALALVCLGAGAGIAAAAAWVFSVAQDFAFLVGFFAALVAGGM